MTTAVDWHDPRLNERLKVALLVAVIVHVVLLIAVQLHAAAVAKQKPRPPLTVQLQSEREPPPKPAPKPAPAPRKEAPAATPEPTAKAPVKTPEKPVAKPRSQPVPTPPAPSKTPSADLPAAPKPTAPAQPVPAPVIANREPPPPAVSREQAAAAAQALARAALKPLAPTPDAGEAPTNFGAPVAAPADKAPAPVSSESQRPSVGGPAASYDEAATQRKIAGIDQTLAAGSPSGGSAPADGYLADGTARGSALGGGSSGVMWDGDGAGCGKPVVDPKPVVSGITGGGVTYHIEVQFRVDANGLVTGVDIVKSGNSALNSAVLSAARGMRFDCTAEARGRRTYEIKPGGR